jgi:hypothetical protein
MRNHHRGQSFCQHKVVDFVHKIDQSHSRPQQTADCLRAAMEANE